MFLTKVCIRLRVVNRNAFNVEPIITDAFGFGRMKSIKRFLSNILAFYYILLLNRG